MMAMVSVDATRRGDAWECTVDVDDPRGATHHTVLLTERDRERWGRPDETVEQLVQRAFEFLLAREAPPQILRRFGLSDIQRYFPEFDEESRG
jgi:hypothetical protein